MAKDWWKSYFDENYIEFLTSQGEFNRTNKEIRLLEKNVPLKKSQLILDLCCGHGRHTLELAKKGYKAIGLDYSNYELDLARKEAKEKGLDVEFRQGDARTFTFKERFDVIINMFTAFGYGSKEDDRAIIKNVVRNLKKGGKFFIDYINSPWLIRNYKAKDRKVFNNKVAVIKREYNFLTGVNTEQRTFIEKGKEKRYTLSIRLYTLAQMAELLEREGLKVLKYWGKNGEPYGLDSKRMSVLAKKV